MNIKRLPIAFMIGGLVLKALLVLLWKFFRVPELMGLLTTYDPGAFAFAEKGAGLFFDQRRIAPAPGESALFEVLLVIGFGIECLLVGLLVRWFLRRYQSPRAGEVGAGPQVTGGEPQ